MILSPDMEDGLDRLDIVVKLSVSEKGVAAIYVQPGLPDTGTYTVKVCSGEQRFSQSVVLEHLEKDSTVEIIESPLYLYRVMTPYVYTINADGRYTVYDFKNCRMVCQTADLNTMDAAYREVFRNKTNFTDLISYYKERKGEYPVIPFGDGTIYLQHNTQKDTFELHSKIQDGEQGFDGDIKQRMVKGVEVPNVCCYKVFGDCVYIIDTDSHKSIVNFKTYISLYNQTIDKTNGAYLAEFDRGGFIAAKDAF